MNQGAGNISPNVFMNTEKREMYKALVMVLDSLAMFLIRYEGMDE